MIWNFKILNKFVHWIRNFFFLPMRAMPRELGKKYDMRRESYVGSLNEDYSKATVMEIVQTKAQNGLWNRWLVFLNINPYAGGMAIA